MEFIHNYALKLLAERKFKDAFWGFAPVLGAIKPKFEAYLEGIEYRLKLLESTPRKRATDGKSTVLVKGFFKEYIPNKTYQKQTATEIPVDLLMDDGMCQLYGNLINEVAQNMKSPDPAHNEENLQALVTLAVMELQFMHGCNVDWKAQRGSAGLSSAEDEDNAGEDESAENEVENTEDTEDLDFASIDSTDVLSEGVWNDLDYPNPDKFVKCRESYAMAILFFLSDELSCKYPVLSGQVHAGWKSAFGRPVSLDQLIERPDKISTMFTEDEEEWFTATIQHFVSNKTAEQLADLGITDAQLEQLGIPKPNPAKAAAASHKVKTNPFCNICEQPGADVCSLNFAAAGRWRAEEIAGRPGVESVAT